MHKGRTNTRYWLKQNLRNDKHVLLHLYWSTVSIPTTGEFREINEDSHHKINILYFKLKCIFLYCGGYM